jgi:hypothetical protein
MFKKFIRGFGIILKAEILMWIIFLMLAGVIHLVSQAF